LRLPDVGQGTANGAYLRRSLKTASWKRATELSRIIERFGQAYRDARMAKARELGDAMLYKREIQQN
jgi:hypothetical protein